MAYTDAGDFLKGMQGKKGVNVLCMEKMYGILGCPDCAEAKRLYAASEAAGEKKGSKGPLEVEAKSHYHKKTYWCFGIINAVEKAQHNRICLINMPATQVKLIVDNVTHKNELVRWPDPADIPHGRPLAISKTDKGDGSDYAAYSTILGNQEWPLTMEWFNENRVKLPSMDDPAALQIAIDTWGAENMFSPYSDMKKGETVLIRLLPHNSRPGATPFVELMHHFKTTPTPWDMAWKEVQYKPARAQEVLNRPDVIAFMETMRAKAGHAGAAPQQYQPYTEGYAGTPAAGQPTQQGVAPTAGGITLPTAPGINLP